MRAERKLSTLAIIVWVLMASVQMTNLPSAEAQEPVFDYLAQAIDKLTVHPSSADMTDYDCFTNGICSFGVNLDTDEYREITAYFDKDADYLVFGAGDDRILELDLKLLSSSGMLRAEDGSNDAFPALQFSPGTSGEMRLRISNISSLGTGFCIMLILEKSDSADFSLDLFREAFNNLDSTSLPSQLTSSRFARETFCLIGGSLREGQSTYLYNSKPGAGNFTLVGAGSSNVANVDIFVYRQRRLDSPIGRLVARDTDSNNHPSCLFTAEAGHYFIKNTNHTSHDDEAGFVFSILLQNTP